MGFTAEWYHYAAIVTATLICSVFICIGCKLLGERNMKRMIMMEWARQNMLAQMNQKPPEVVVPVSLRVEDDPRLAVMDTPGDVDAGEEAKLGFVARDIASQRKDNAEWQLYSNRLAERYGLEPGNYRELDLSKPPDTPFGLYFEEHRPVVGLVEPDSAAQQQGVEPGMRIIAINNTRVYSPSDAVEIFQQQCAHFVCVVDIDPVDDPNLRQVSDAVPAPPPPPKKEHFIDNEVENLLQNTWEKEQGEDVGYHQGADGDGYLSVPFVAAPPDPPPPPMFDQFKHTIRMGDEEDIDNDPILELSPEERASLPRRRAPPATLIRDHSVLGLPRPKPLANYVSPPGIRRNNPSNIHSKIRPPRRMQSQSQSLPRSGAV